MTPPLTIFLTFLRLGLTSFGGPVAHLGYFRGEFVTRRRWLADREFADIVALCQFLPGPASSEVGIAIGLRQGGLLGAVAAWTGFTLPSAALMIGFAEAADRLDPAVAQKWLHGLLIVAVAVVAQAVIGMARSFTPDLTRAVFAVLAAGAILAFPGQGTTLAVLAVGASAGWSLLTGKSEVQPEDDQVTRWPRGLSWAAGMVFLALLLVLPLADGLIGSHTVSLVDRFYRVGALVFGGGHVVLPMLQAEIVPRGWMTEQQFLAGYGAAQAVPGPLFTFAAYLGAAANQSPNGILGGLIALGAIFLPSFLMVAAALPHWSALRTNRQATAALGGVNAAVVGILLAALYRPVFTSAIHGPVDLILALAGFAALQVWRAPPWTVVLATALAARLVA
jgi:chromate transporter